MSEAIKIGIGSPPFHDFLADFIVLLAEHGEDEGCRMPETVSGQMLFGCRPNPAMRLSLAISAKFV